MSAVWLKQAADINHPGAQAKLGYLYSTGQGVPRNYQEAVKWLEMAAGQGDPDAQYNLAILENEGPVPAATPAPETGLVTAPPADPADAAPEVLPTPGQDAGETWILQQDPERYTIQVIALSAPDKLHAFIAANPDRSPFALYRQIHYQRPLWVMVQGNYEDAEAAHEAVQSFPGGLHLRHDLWIRKFGMVQRLIE